VKRVNLAVMLACACAAPHARPGAGATSTRVPLEPFTRLKVGSAVRVSVRPGPCAISVRADEAARAALTASVQAGELAIGLRAGAPEQAASLLEIEVEAAGLEAIDATEGAEVAAVVAPTASFEASASSAAALVVSQIDAEAVLVQATTGATVVVDGRASALTLVASGGAAARAGDLVVRELQLDASGSAELEAHVTHAARGELASGATLKVRGSPKVVALSTSGGGQATFER
jgi:hypothetical protein